ncbi:MULTISPECIES: hypothetical protein [Nostocales]|uniref:Uncharacterized protein n=2 Tax=Aphanizomenonaceae TaxID=1892259 RepID=A0ACC7S5K9_DOLFA|nr:MULTISPECIES: hypothetical protein [Nostocales]MBO1070351.1 hypothetical protein [Dolichospermum sp. DEX189]MCX5984759.1 hypothetical protein [Nostocales cyanobacterium LacPavin_0920_SED1_MAG_38_18]ALB43713.1 hypothetical protein AA650_25250 [Anabaena sp. WA102]MBD2280565.1 hypothetical protein [Aphanizomenon flos-aquae FACHB-1040]MBO1064611.1 hypothetical protein [Anabaena sp. 54]
MLQAIEGIYKDGKVELKELPSDISESFVIVTFLKSKKNHKKDQIMLFGMFSGNQQSTEADFEIAEFHGDSEDSLDWS